MKALQVMALVTVAVFAVLPMHAAGRLRSPWDGHPVTLTNAPYSCPAIVHLSPDLTTNGFYSDSKSSIIDPEKWKVYAASSGPYKDLGNRIVARSEEHTSELQS